MPTTSDQALYTVLAAATGLTALLGTATAGGPCIMPVEAAEGSVLPALMYQIIATNPVTTHGEGVTDARLDAVTISLSAYDSTQLKCAAILYQARKAIEGSTLKGVVTNELTLPRADDAVCHGRVMDLLIWNYPDS